MIANNKLKKQMFAGLFLTMIFGLFFFINNAAAQTGNPLGGDVNWSELNKIGLRGTSGVQTLIGRIIRAVMGVIGSIALLMFVAGGFMWMTASGNSEKTAKAMRILTWSSLGIVVIFSAYVLVNFVFSAYVD